MNRHQRRAAGHGGEAEAMFALIGQHAASGAFIGAAIVGALVERGAVDPLQVAKWATMFAEGEAASNQPVAGVLGEFARLVTAMATVPAGAGRG